MDEFIEVEKDGEHIWVHPLALEDHKRLGWKVVETEAVAAETEDAPESEGKEPGKKPIRRRVGS